MSDKTYFVIGDDNCKYEAMTKEQVINAIQQAVSTGTITDIDAGFITKVKELNKNRNITFWVGTQAEYNAIETKADNCFYIISNNGNFAQLKQTVDELIEKVDNLTTFNTLQEKEITLPASSGFALYGSSDTSKIMVRKVGRVVTLTGMLTNKYGASKNTISELVGETAFTLPKEFKPIQHAVNYCVGSGNDQSFCFEVHSSGECSISRYRDANGKLEPTAGAWLPFHISYISAE